MITPEMLERAREIGEERSRRDRADLARMIRENKIHRDAAIGRNVAGAAEFQTEIEQLVRPKINTAIRPNKKKRR